MNPGGTATKGADFHITPFDEGTVNNPPLGSKLTFFATQDHKAEKAETLSYTVIEVDDGETTNYTVNIKILDRSSRDDYIRAAFSSAANVYNPNNETTQFLQQAKGVVVVDFRGAFNDPQSDNLEARDAERYIIGVQSQQVDYSSWENFMLNLDAARAAGVALPYEALKLFPPAREWLSTDGAPTTPPGGLAALFEGEVAGLNNGWRQYLPPGYAPQSGVQALVSGAAASATGVAFYDLRQTSFQKTLVIGSENYTVHGVTQLPASTGPAIIFESRGAPVQLDAAKQIIYSHDSRDLRLGGGDDVAVAFAPGAVVDGEDGNDLIVLGDAGGFARGGLGRDLLAGGAGADTLSGGAEDDFLDGGAGADVATFAGASNSYEWWRESNGSWRVRAQQSGVDGADVLTAVELLQFSDRTVELSVSVGIDGAVQNILRAGLSNATAATLATKLSSLVNSGALTASSALAEVVKAADATTSVATLSYQFFTGKIPSPGGIDYLVSPTGPNPNNINSAYYQSFNLENRYINFAVNLGKLGEGQQKFGAEFGALTLEEATKKAYALIFGAAPTDAKVDALLDPAFTLNGVTMTRAEYFESYGRDGPNGIGTKAAMVGWLLAEAEKADLGSYARSNAAFLTDLADGAAWAVDLIGVYGRAEFVYGG
jgi:hypothetical protein